MRIQLVYTQARGEECEGPDAKASRYALTDITSFCTEDISGDYIKQLNTGERSTTMLYCDAMQLHNLTDPITGSIMYPSLYCSPTRVATAKLCR
jgi:hypothetical protein